PAHAFAGPVAKHTPAKVDGAVHITAIAADIEIVGSDGSEVKVSGELPDGVKLELSSTGKRVEVKVKHPQGETQGHGKLRVELPRGSEVDVKTVSGDLSVRGVNGVVRIGA